MIPKQCKDIPDGPILAFLVKNPEQWHTWLGRYPHSVEHACPEGTPPKLILAKMRMMIRKGTVQGCDCGCRGDFVITEKGKAALQNFQPIKA